MNKKYKLYLIINYFFIMVKYSKRMMSSITKNKYNRNTKSKSKSKLRKSIKKYVRKTMKKTMKKKYQKGGDTNCCQDEHDIKVVNIHGRSSEDLYKLPSGVKIITINNVGDVCPLYYKVKETISRFYLSGNTIFEDNDETKTLTDAGRSLTYELSRIGDFKINFTLHKPNDVMNNICFSNFTGSGCGGREKNQCSIDCINLKTKDIKENCTYEIVNPTPCGITEDNIVKVHSTSKPELNGKLGIISSILESNLKKFTDIRYRVILLDDLDKKVKKVKSYSLKSVNLTFDFDEEDIKGYPEKYNLKPQKMENFTLDNLVSVNGKGTYVVMACRKYSQDYDNVARIASGPMNLTNKLIQSFKQKKLLNE